MEILIGFIIFIGIWISIAIMMRSDSDKADHDLLQEHYNKPLKK